MPFNTRLDRVIGFIQREHDKAAAEADARRPHRTRHHDLLLIEDAPSTAMDDEDEDHWREGGVHVVHPFPARPMSPHGGLAPIPEEGSERPCPPECPCSSARRPHHHEHDASPSPSSSCASCGGPAIYRSTDHYQDKVVGAMIERLAAMEVDVSVPPNARRAWAVAISAVEADDPVAVAAVVRASQEGVRPEEAMQRVVDAVLGSGAAKGDDAGGGGSKHKGKEKEAQKKQRKSQGGERRGHEAVKHVACVCM